MHKLVRGVLRMRFYASWQNFAKIGFPANLTITVRSGPKFHAGTRSECPEISNFDPIREVIPSFCEPWPECHSVFLALDT